MLLELMRTRRFHASAGAVVWRVELWYFQNQFGGWEKLPNQERVLRRERITPGQWRRISVEYTPRLSVYVEPTGYAKPLKYTIADKPDPSRGRPAGSDPQLRTEPHILGLDAPGAPATRPAGAASTSQPAGR